MRKQKLSIFIFVLVPMFGNVSLASDTGLNKARVQQFIVMGYEGIRLDLKSNNGPYLNTLIDLMSVGPAEQKEFINQVREIQKANPNIMDFADRVLALGAPQISSAPQVPLPTGDDVFSGDELEVALAHLTKGMRLTVITKSGARFEGKFEDYVSKRLWVRGAKSSRFQLNEILAIQSPDL